MAISATRPPHPGSDPPRQGSDLALGRPGTGTTRLTGTDDGTRLVRVNAPQSLWRGFVPAVTEIWRYRDLLVNLVRKELKVKYKGSTLGFLWSLARPLFLLGIYYVVFAVFLRVQIENFPIYLFSGLICWEFFGATLGGSTMSVVGNAGLVKKVWFPREILPLATVGAGIVHFFLQLGVLFVVLVAVQHDFISPNLLLLPIAFVALVMFATGVGLFLAAANVYARDVQHLIEVFLLFWFWMTPIVYFVQPVLEKLGPAHLATLYMLNPMANVVIAFQRALYNADVLAGSDFGGYLPRLLAVIAFSAGLIWLGQRVFARAEGNFAQEL